MVLADLADGKHTIEFAALSTDGKTASVTRTFTVQEAIPTLAVFKPEPGNILTSNTVQIFFQSNSPVELSFDGNTNSISNGDFITLPEDGSHRFTLTATHPVTGNVVRQIINFKSDTVAPQVEIISPRPTVYVVDDIPISFTENRPTGNVKFFLDGAEVLDLNDVTPGSHNFRIVTTDVAGRQASGAAGGFCGQSAGNREA